VATIRITIEIEAPDDVVGRIAELVSRIVEHASPDRAPSILSLEVSDVSGRLTLRVSQA
jgi:hypothetical protein